MNEKKKKNKGTYFSKRSNKIVLIQNHTEIINDKLSAIVHISREIFLKSSAKINYLSFIRKC